MDINLRVIDTHLFTVHCPRSILTLKAPRKNASENVVCYCRLLQINAYHADEISIGANSVDQKQTALVGAV